MLNLNDNWWLLAGYVALEFNTDPGKKAIKKSILTMKFCMNLSTLGILNKKNI